MPLPTTTSFLTSLLSTFPPTSESHHSPPSSISTATKPTLLTLHAIFPTTLLPALDLLDRRLVTRFILRNDGTEGVEEAEAAKNEGKIEGRKRVYYVKSNAQRDGRSRYSRGGGADAFVTSYEVRTEAWSCTCAAFAFSAFNNAGVTPEYGDYDDECEVLEGEITVVNEDEEMLDVPEAGGGGDREREWQWGGLMRGEEEVPICKHLLACVLAERWDVARGMVEEREVGREEMAGWAAGWGG